MTRHDGTQPLIPWAGETGGRKGETYIVKRKTFMGSGPFWARHFADLIQGIGESRK